MALSTERLSVVVIAPDAKEVSVPTEVRLEVTTVLFSSVPVRVPAAAVTVIAAVPSKSTPLIALAVAKAVAVAAFPVQDPEDPEALPVTFPVKAPAKPVAVRTPEDELKVRFVPLFGGRSPVAAVTN